MNDKKFNNIVKQMMEENMNDKKWIDDISKVFLNQKIVKIEIMTNKEAEALGWDQRAVMFKLENGTWFFASQDDEGNGAGAIHTTKEHFIVPVMH